MDSISTKDFVYQLPPELIAKDPPAKRDQSRLLNYDRKTERITHHVFRDMVSILQPTDVLVVNNTQVMPVRLVGNKANGSMIEILLIKPQPGQSGLWQALGPLKKLKKGETIYIAGKTKSHRIVIEDIITAVDGQKRLLIKLSDLSDDKQTFAILQDAGNPPLPPYIVQARRNTTKQQMTLSQEKNDLERYQTIFAKYPGAIAAPTAGLHFTSSLLGQLKAKGISICEITLHVGPGTFKPITTSIDEHIIEPEWFAISKLTAKNINAAKKEGHRVIAVGTTTCRALESNTIGDELQATDGSSTSLFIKPGYQFKLIDGLVTNFHLSQSSLLLLVAAFMGQEELKQVYKLAIEQKYRFYSYGDAMIIL